MRNARLALSLTALALSLAPHYTCAQDRGLAPMIASGGLRAEDSNGRVLVAHRDQTLLIPASTAKLVTSFCVLEELGREYRFTTNFYKGKRGELFVQGAGDPGMVSEELAVIGTKLARVFPHVEKIVIDTSYFADDLDVDGASRSLNPYDSRNAAFVGNFSTAALSRKASGEVISTELQTPLTPLARAAGARLKKGASERINLGHDWRTGVRYGGELLAAFLSRGGATGPMTVELGKIPSDAKLILSHSAGSDLAGLVRGLLKYSTNFTANQLFLHLGAVRYGAPATVEKGQRAVETCLKEKAGWTNFHIEEGSGLSRKTRVSPEHLVKLLAVFEPYRGLLSEEDGFMAKTGTLTGVNTLAGYFESKKHGRVRFAILINRNVPFAYKFQVARKLRAVLD